MKKMLFSAASLLVLLGSCSQNELEENVVSKGQHVVTATIEGQNNSRLSVEHNEETKVFSLSWSNGDSFKVFGEDDDAAVYNWGSGNDFTLNEDDTDPENPKYAVYPYTDANSPSISDATVTMTLSATPLIKNINLPMWATPSTTEGATEYSFRHLAAALQFTLNDIPSGYTKLIVEASKPISGTFTADLSKDTPVLESTSTDDANKKVTINFEAATGTETKTQVFYIPLPVGTYQSLKVSVGSNDNSETKELKSWTDLKVVRGKMYYTTATVNASSIDAVNQALQNAGKVATTVNLTEEITAGEEPLVIPAEAENVTLNFNQAPNTTETSPLLINQNENASSSEATTKLNITMPNGASDLHAKIVAPTTTVTLTNGTYESLEAITATNTLIIEEGVTIKKLVVNGGNVVLKGNVVNFTSTEVTTTTITLESDIKLTEPWQFANGSEVVLDLNGHCITSADTYNATLTTLLAVHNGAKLTVKDGSAEQTGSIDTKNGGTKYTYAAILLTTKPSYNEAFPAELVVESGTLKGDLYAVSGNGSRKNTKVTINDGLLSSYDQTVGCGIFHPQAGEITINGGTVEAYLTAIEMRGGTLVVEDGTLTATCAEETKSIANPNGATIYGAAIGVSQHTTNNNLSVTIKGGTLTGSSALYEEDTCNDDNTSGISMSVTGGTLNGKVYSENCPSFIAGGTFSDASAFNYLADNAEVKLGAECELSSLVAIKAANATIDLNEKTVTANCQKAFEVYADATIKNGTIVSQQRCVDTREAVNLVLTDVVLNAPQYYSAYGNQQPLTIGGSENGTTVTMDRVTINAGTTGYGIISFVKTELNATDCKVDGYVVLYSKADSDESEYVFTDCDLTNDITNNDVAGNSTTLINIEGAQGVKVNVNGGTVTSKGDNTAAVGFRAEATGNSVTIKDATITGNILYNYSEGNTVIVPATLADNVTSQGYTYERNDDDTITITDTTATEE